MLNKSKLFTIRFIVVLSLSIVVLNAKANDALITQGETVLTFKDVDGFAFKMSNEIRSGFFEKPDRIDTLLSTMLNMKHVYNDLKNNQDFDFTEINNKVEESVLKLFAKDTDTNYLMEKEKMFNTIKDFLIIEQSYKHKQNLIVKATTDAKVIEYAQEKYMLNKSDYQIAENRSIQYISLPYTDQNKDEIFLKTKEILNGLDKGKFKIDEIHNKYNESVKDIIVSDKIDYLIYNIKQKKFSDFVFAKNTEGLINDILELKKQYLIIKIYSITEARFAEFDEVKSEILKELKLNKASRDFKSYLLELTQDPVDINKENVISLLTRYKHEK